MALFKDVENQQNKLKSAEKSSDARFTGLAVRIFGDFGATIAVPAVVGTFSGIWLDRKLGTEPWLMLVCMGIAFAFSLYIINKKAHKYAEEYDRLIKESKNGQN